MIEREMTAGEYSDYFAKYTGGRNYGNMLAHCPFCGGRNLSSEIKVTEIKEGERDYTVVTSSQIVCATCGARGGKYTRDVRKSLYDARTLANNNFEPFQYACGFWNNRL